MQTNTRIALMGPPGAGKGVQAKRLIEKYSLLHISSGDILRAECKSHSELGSIVSDYMQKGELVPDEIIINVIIKFISENKSQGLLFDGFPRTIQQADALNKALVDIKTPLDAIIVLDVPRQIIVNRITGRRNCPSCGKLYHIETMPPVVLNQCDDCHCELVHRHDDEESVIKQRLESYDNLTEPVILFYKNKKQTVIHINGLGTPDEVTSRIKKAIVS